MTTCKLILSSRPRAVLQQGCISSLAIYPGPRKSQRISEYINFYHNMESFRSEWQHTAVRGFLNSITAPYISRQNRGKSHHWQGKGTECMRCFIVWLDHVLKHITPTFFSPLSMYVYLCLVRTADYVLNKVSLHNCNEIIIWYLQLFYKYIKKNVSFPWIFSRSYTSVVLQQS